MQANKGQPTPNDGDKRSKTDCTLPVIGLRGSQDEQEGLLLVVSLTRLSRPRTHQSHPRE